jgi:tetrahydromethanopterin S-methyltransferase subunit G
MKDETVECGQDGRRIGILFLVVTGRILFTTVFSVFEAHPHLAQW